MKTVQRTPAPKPGEVRRAAFTVTTWGKSAVMSSAKIDRVGDSIDQAGWDLSDFEKNPVMLYNHDHDEPVGIWKNVRLENGNLTGDPEFHPGEVNPLAGRLDWLYANGKLKAFSVGFIPTEFEPMPDGSGWRIKRAKLLECSAVVIPANTDAMMKGANVLPVFGGEFDPRSPLPVVAKATELQVQSPAMNDEIRALIASEIAKALGSLREPAQPATQPAAEVADEGAVEGENEDPVAHALAAADQALEEAAELLADIEGDQDE